MKIKDIDEEYLEARKYKRIIVKKQQCAGGDNKKVVATNNDYNQL